MLVPPLVLPADAAINADSDLSSASAPPIDCRRFYTLDDAYGSTASTIKYSDYLGPAAIIMPSPLYLSWASASEPRTGASSVPSTPIGPEPATLTRGRQFVKREDIHLLFEYPRTSWTLITLRWS
jgi:hypothetical protein